MKFKTNVVVQCWNIGYFAIAFPGALMHFYVADCSSIFDLGSTNSGVYPIWIKQQFRSIFLRCDMDTANSVTSKRGWSVIQRRVNGKINFERGWDDYVHGFGSLSDEFWVGLENIYHLTLQCEISHDGTVYFNYPQLRIDLEDWDGIKAFVEHGQYAILPQENNFRIVINFPQHGPAVLGENTSPLSQVEFSTFDADNDESPATNVAIKYRSGWWFRLFPLSSLNGPYPKIGEKMSDYNIYWYYWEKINPNRTALKHITMKLQMSIDS